MAAPRSTAPALVALLLCCAPAQAQDAAALQRQIDELKAQLRVLEDRVAAHAAATARPAPVASALPATAAPAVNPPRSPTRLAAVPAPPARRPWYERLRLRGYTQMRYNAVLDGDRTAPAGVSRLRSVHDASISEDGGFSLRRARLVLQGDVTDRISLYFQHDFATAVNNQSVAERREHFGQLRDVYADVFLDDARTTRIRVGQSKVPFGWENMQSSSNRLTLDRSDAINSASPGERDLGIIAYHTPSAVQAIWDRLSRGGQKLFGNYGAFGLGVMNGQGTNRTERNGSRMAVALATWPFALDALGGGWAGQVLEVGGAAMLNRFRPEVRTGGVAPVDYPDRRVALHAILYPQPFGIQAEWTWGRAPAFDLGLDAIRARRLNGGYVQAMYDLPGSGPIPYLRWQRYRGGWKAAVNTPLLDTEEVEIGIEWPLLDSLELTVAYANMARREADERRGGRATGDLLRTQLQWSY